MRVLIVDDEPTIRELVALALTDAGHEVDCAPDGTAALDLAERQRPELILLDVHLPGMTAEAFAQAERRRAGPRAPIIVFTAEDGAAHAARIGAAGYLPKPFDLDRLLEIVNRHGRPGRQDGGGALEARDPGGPGATLGLSEVAGARLSKFSRALESRPGPSPD